MMRLELRLRSLHGNSRIVFRIAEGVGATNTGGRCIQPVGVNKEYCRPKIALHLYLCGCMMMRQQMSKRATVAPEY